jgi:tetratricopeptide (TPR) repeat protein
VVLMMNQTNLLDHSQLEYVESLIAKAFDAEQRNTEDALKIAMEALDLSKRNGFIKQEAISYLRIGRCHWIKSDFKEALDYLGNALEIANRIQELYTKVEVLIGMGNVYITMELIDQAMTHYYNALEIATEHGYGELESKLLNNIGTMHEDLKDYAVALGYYQKCLEKSIEIGDKYAIAIAHVNMGNVFMRIDRLDEAKNSVLLAINYGVENRKNLLLAHSYHSMGRIHQKLLDYKQSIKYLMLGADEAIECKDLVILFRIYLELASAYDSKNDYDNAETISKKRLNYPAKSAWMN